jgi:hypothetical protein
MNAAKDSILDFQCVWGLLATRRLLLLYDSVSSHIDSAKSLRYSFPAHGSSRARTNRSDPSPPPASERGHLGRAGFQQGIVTCQFRFGSPVFVLKDQKYLFAKVCSSLPTVSLKWFLIVDNRCCTTVTAIHETLHECRVDLNRLGIARFVRAYESIFLEVSTTILLVSSLL